MDAATQHKIDDKLKAIQANEKKIRGETKKKGEAEKKIKECNAAHGMLRKEISKLAEESSKK
jgi:hypothetical protein